MFRFKNYIISKTKVTLSVFFNYLIKFKTFILQILPICSTVQTDIQNDFNTGKSNTPQTH